MKLDIEKLTEFEFDALKEVANIGAAHAATALSQIIEKTVLIHVSRVNIIPVEDIEKLTGNPPRQKVVMVHLKVLGGLAGGLILVWDWYHALKMAAILRKEPVECINQLTEMDCSGLKESGSIIIAAYLRAIGELMHLVLIPTVPELSSGDMHDILDKVLCDLSKRSNVAFCMETEFIESNHKLRGRFLLIPNAESVAAIFSALGIAEKSRSGIL